MSSATTTILYSVWGTSDQDVYAGGANVILHYDGSRWIAVDSLQDNFVGISGAGPRDVYVVGNKIVCHYDGESWTTVSMPVEGDLDPCVGGVVAECVHHRVESDSGARNALMRETATTVVILVASPRGFPHNLSR